MEDDFLLEEQRKFINTKTRSAARVICKQPLVIRSCEANLHSATHALQGQNERYNLCQPTLSIPPSKSNEEQDDTPKRDMVQLGPTVNSNVAHFSQSNGKSSFETFSHEHQSPSTSASQSTHRKSLFLLQHQSKHLNSPQIRINSLVDKHWNDSKYHEANNNSQLITVLTDKETQKNDSFPLKNVECRQQKVSSLASSGIGSQSSQILHPDASQEVHLSIPMLFKTGFPESYHQSQSPWLNPVYDEAKISFPNERQDALNSQKDETISVNTISRYLGHSNSKKNDIVTEKKILDGSENGIPAQDIQDGLISNGTLLNEVRKENEDKLKRMSKQEIEKMIEQLHAEVDPKLIEKIKSITSSRLLLTQENRNYNVSSRDETRPQHNEPMSNNSIKDYPCDMPKGRESQSMFSSKNPTAYLEQLERSKLEWTAPITEEEMKPGPQIRMQAELYRFDFEGRLLFYPDTQGLVPLEPIATPNDIGMLLHHGLQPGTPGYSLEEIAILSRSTFPAQRLSALKAFRSIILRAKHSQYLIPGMDKFNFANSLILTHLIQEIKISMLLRHSLDETNPSILYASIQTMQALICSETDERAFAWAERHPELGYVSWPLSPLQAGNNATKKKTIKQSSWDEASDHEKSEIDLVMALCGTGILARFRYIIEVIQPPCFLIMNIFDIMIRMARHSQQVCPFFTNCPRLLPLMQEFISFNHSGLGDSNTTNLTSFKNILNENDIENECQTKDFAYKHPRTIVHSLKDSMFNSLTTFYALKLVRVLCQSSRKVAKAFKSIFDDVLKYLLSVISTETSNFNETKCNSTNHLENSTYSQSLSLDGLLEALKVIETNSRYGCFTSDIMEIYPILVELVSNLSPSHSSKLSPLACHPLTRAHAFRILESMCYICQNSISGSRITAKKPPESPVDLGQGKTTVLYHRCQWFHLSPILQISLDEIKLFSNSFEIQMKLTHESIADDIRPDKLKLKDLNNWFWTDHAVILLSSILQFISTYFNQLEEKVNFEHRDKEKMDILRISHLILGPFLTQSPIMDLIFSNLTKPESWKSKNLDSQESTSNSSQNNANPDFLDMYQLGKFVLSLVSHPTLSWRHQQPVDSTERYVKNRQFSLLSKEKEQSLLDCNPPKMSAHAAVILASLNLIESIGLHDKTFRPYLTSTEIAKPLLVILEHYFEFALSLSSSSVATYVTRTIHHMAAKAIKLIYHGSAVAQQASLVCLGCLLPGDELLALYLIKRVIFQYIRDLPEDYFHVSMDRKLNISPLLLNFFTDFILRGNTPSEDEVDAEDGKKIDSGENQSPMLVNENPSQKPVQDHSQPMYYPREYSINPLDRQTLLLPVEFSALPLSKNWIFLPLQRYCRHLCIIQQSKNLQDIQKKPNGPNEKYIFHHEKQFDVIETDIRFIVDSLHLINNMRMTNGYFFSKVKRSVYLSTLIELFTAGVDIFGHEQVATLLVGALEQFITNGQWEPLTLAFHRLDMVNLEKLIDVWSNSSYGHVAIGKCISMWLLAGASLTPQEIQESGQAAELKTLDHHLWPQFVLLWHTLPPPFDVLYPHYFNPNIALRDRIITYLISSLNSRHVIRLRTARSFYYQFLIFQVANYIWSDAIPHWTRQNTLISIFHPTNHLLSEDQILAVIHDIMTISLESTTLTQKRKGKMAFEDPDFSPYPIEVDLAHLKGIDQRKKELVQLALEGVDNFQFAPKILEIISQHGH